jgi:hypothetical protein
MLVQALVQVPWLKVIGTVAVLLCIAWAAVFVATAAAKARGFRVSIDRPGVERVDAAWFAFMLVLAAELAFLAATYAFGWRALN